MDNKAYVRLVDPHAESNRRHHDQTVFLLEPPLGDAPVLGLHPTVVMERDMPGIAQGSGQRFGLGPCAAVDDPGLPLAGGGKVKDLAARSVLGSKGQVNIGSVERPDHAATPRSANNQAGNRDPTG